MTFKRVARFVSGRTGSWVSCSSSYDLIAKITTHCHKTDAYSQFSLQRADKKRPHCSISLFFYLF